ncbi:MAG: hypothetical protein ABI305_01585, partial [Tepidiformaceae bacterium]
RDICTVQLHLYPSLDNSVSPHGYVVGAPTVCLRLRRKYLAIWGQPKSAKEPAAKSREKQNSKKRKISAVLTFA